MLTSEFANCLTQLGELAWKPGGGSSLRSICFDETDALLSHRENRQKRKGKAAI
jgi:hypothetical protein